MNVSNLRGTAMYQTLNLSKNSVPGYGLALLLVAFGSHAAAAAQPVYTTFDPPGSVETFPESINDTGAISGWYYDSKGMPHGFVRTNDGTITSFDPPGSTATFSYGINRTGVIAGYYADSN